MFQWIWRTVTHQLRNNNSLVLILLFGTASLRRRRIYRYFLKVFIVSGLTNLPFNLFKSVSYLPQMSLNFSESIYLESIKSRRCNEIVPHWKNWTVVWESISGHSEPWVFITIRCKFYEKCQPMSENSEHIASSKLYNWKIRFSLSWSVASKKKYLTYVYVSLLWSLMCLNWRIRPSQMIT